MKRKKKEEKLGRKEEAGLLVLEEKGMNMVRMGEIGRDVGNKKNAKRTKSKGRRIQETRMGAKEERYTQKERND